MGNLMTPDQALCKTKYPERRSWFASQKNLWKKNSYTPEFTNMTSWKIPISNRTYMTYIFKEGGGCSHVSFPGGGGCWGTPKKHPWTSPIILNFTQLDSIILSSIQSKGDAAPQKKQSLLGESSRNQQCHSTTGDHILFPRFVDHSSRFGVLENDPLSDGILG